MLAKRPKIKDCRSFRVVTVAFERAENYYS